jgi:hypothetical protein
MVANNAFMIEEMKAKAEKEGIKEGKVEILVKILRKKFGVLPQDYENKIRKLSEEVIDRITTDIFDISNVEELNKYFEKQK